MIRNRSYESSEERARRQFGEYKINTYVKGDTAWIVGNGKADVQKVLFRCDGERAAEIELVKIETEGGGIVTTDFGV